MTAIFAFLYTQCTEAALSAKARNASASIWSNTQLTRGASILTQRLRTVIAGPTFTAFTFIRFNAKTPVFTSECTNGTHSSDNIVVSVSNEHKPCRVIYRSIGKSGKSCGMPKLGILRETKQGKLELPGQISIDHLLIVPCYSAVETNQDTHKIVLEDQLGLLQ
jgi:hypothetical protein